MYKVKKEVVGLGLRKECPLGREDFRETMTALQEAFNQKCALHKLLGGIGDLKSSLFESYALDYIEAAITPDHSAEYQWLKYFVYELDMGKKYYPGIVANTDWARGVEQNIKLGTIDDCYDFLIGKPNYEN